VAIPAIEIIHFTHSRLQRMSVRLDADGWVCLDFGQPFAQCHGDSLGPLDRRHMAGSMDLE
jgi:hypothetical protein